MAQTCVREVAKFSRSSWRGLRAFLSDMACFKGRNEMSWFRISDETAVSGPSSETCVCVCVCAPAPTRAHVCIWSDLCGSRCIQVRSHLTRCAIHMYSKSDPLDFQVFKDNRESGCICVSVFVFECACVCVCVYYCVCLRVYVRVFALVYIHFDSVHIGHRIYKTRKVHAHVSHTSDMWQIPWLSRGCECIMSQVYMMHVYESCHTHDSCTWLIHVYICVYVYMSYVHQ